MRCLAVLICVAATSLGAQQPEPAPAESVPVDSPRAPATPTPEQQRFLGGLRTATRGLAQLKDGVNRVTRAQGTSDAAAQRRYAAWSGSWSRPGRGPRRSPGRRGNG